MANSTWICKKCGLGLGAGNELCPRCLLNANFGSTAGTPSSATGGVDPHDEIETAVTFAGETIDRKYRIERALGRGGMGSVFLATHIGTKRLVALKLISAEWTANAEFQMRFRREAEALGRLRHPNVVNVTDFGIAPFEGRDMAYLVMEYLDGVTLAAYQAEHRPLPIRMVLDILDQVASALDTAHEAGIVHRDLKPENIWIEPNRLGGFNARVLDFGIAQMADPARQGAQAPPATQGASTVDVRMESVNAPTEDTRTQRGRILGTPAYMSPEQCRGEALDGRADVYSLGVIAYLLLAGELPFTGSSAELIHKHVHEPPLPLHKRRPGISRAVSQSVAAALQKNSEDRPRTPSAFASMLRTNAEAERSLLPRGRQLTSALPSLSFGLFLLSGSLGTLLAALVLIGLTSLRLGGPWLDVACAAGMMAVLLFTANSLKAAWTMALQDVLAKRQYELRVFKVLSAYAGRLPVLLLKQGISVFKTQPPFAKCLWPVISVMEPAAVAAERSRVLTTGIRYPAATLTIRYVVFAILAVTFSLFIVPSIMFGKLLDGAEIWIFESVLASFIFTISSMSTLASFPFLYLRGRSMRSEGHEPMLPATDTPEFRGNRIPVLTSATKLWIAAGLLALAVSVYARMHTSSPERWKTADSLISAAELGRVRRVDWLLSSGADVNSHLQPWTPLTRATLFGHEGVVDVLIKAGADIDFDPAPGTALYLAAVARRNAILKKLLDHGANPNTAASWGLTPLMVAAAQGNEPAVRLLLQHGADPKRHHPDGRLAADLAREEGYTAVVRLLEREETTNKIE